MITIAGGTGNLGSLLVSRLAAQGLQLRVLTRDPGHLSAPASPGVEVVSADVRDPDALERAIAGSQTVISAITGFGGRDAGGAQAIDRDGNHNLIAAAKAQGVEHFILISVVQAAADHPIELFRMKFAAEEELHASGLTWTIIRPTAYMQTWVRIVGGPILETGKTRIFGAGNNPINFVSAVDVAGLVELAVVEPQFRNAIVEIGGPENLTLNQLAASFEATTGRTGEKSHAPLPMMRVMSLLLKRVKPILAAQMRAGVVMDTRDMRFDARAARGRYPSIAPTNLEAMIRHDYARA
jgi:uncharacterized protein YbjT (DUF2867 family)